MATTYEFVVEELDFYEGCGDDPDIIDVNAFDTMQEAAAYAEQCGNPWRIALQRNTGNDADGLTSRFYTYPDANGKLPEYFESATGFQDGPAVPKRFRALVFPMDGRARP